MENLVPLALLLLLVGFIVVPFIALHSAHRAQRRVEELEVRFQKHLASITTITSQVMSRLSRLEERTPGPESGTDAAPEETGDPASLRAVPRAGAPSSPPPEPAAALEIPLRAVPPLLPPDPAPASTAVVSPPLNPLPLTPPPLPVAARTAEAPARSVVTPVPWMPPARAAASPAASPAVNTGSSFKLEQFMGVKLFAWVGGLALFLGLVFFVKLSIERGWISPERRTAIGFVAGLTLLVAGIRIQAKAAYVVLGQTLCATGVVVLYGMTFAAHSFYQFPGFAHPLTGLLLMSLITTTAFWLAVRMPAQVVAVLGMLGGFLTPVICSNGLDHPAGLFGYIAMLDVGVLAVAKRRNWPHLGLLAAGGTMLSQLIWFASFFHPGGYAEGTKTLVPMAVFLGFALLFAVASWRPTDNPALAQPRLPSCVSALALCGAAMLAGFSFLGYSGLTGRPGLLYGYVLLINLVVMALAWTRPRLLPAPVVFALLTFLHLSAWTMQSLTPGMLPAALTVYLVFGLLHTAYLVLWQRRQTVLSAPGVAWVPVITLLLLLLPVLILPAVPLMVWPALLLVDLGIIALALFARAVLPVFAALVLTLLTALAWLLKLPDSNPDSLTLFLGVLGGFTIVFAGASSMLAGKLKAEGTTSLAGTLSRWLPVCSAVLPFALLILALLQFPVPDPSPVFGLALLLGGFLLELGRRTGLPGLPLTALLCVLSVQAVWHVQSYNPTHPLPALGWYLGTYALFALYPFGFRRQLAETTAPWSTAARAGLGTFALVFPLVRQTWPNEMMGLLPAAFALPALASFLTIRRLHSSGNPARLTQLAWFGGVALCFITLIFPIQFDKQWLTIGWALEGAALCWLFRRVPHPGLRKVGMVLLLASFVRLALNPAVLSYQVRGDVAILNWQLYAYGLASAAMFLAARWLAPPRHLMGSLNLRSLFITLGGLLLFLLLNIQIADAFTPAGSRSIVFDFSGNFARDMTYSIAWGLFALTLLAIGFALRSPPTRYAGLGLLGVTLLKLFLHDLANIESVYRIGALIAVALITLAASYLYQRFLDRSEPSEKPSPP